MIVILMFKSHFQMGYNNDGSTELVSIKNSPS